MSQKGRSAEPSFRWSADNRPLFISGLGNAVFRTRMRRQDNIKPQSEQMTGGAPTRLDIGLGPLPIAKVKTCLGLDLPQADVRFFAHRQDHAYSKEPHREAVCSPYYATVIANPTHIGQEPRYTGVAFEIVLAVAPSGPIVLMVINLARTRRGLYSVHTAYDINQNKLERRVRKKILIAL